jgi:cation:H+ antiporter
LEIVYILGGFVGLLLGGEMLVRSAVTVAQRFNVSPLVIGLTLVGFGTSTPELVTSVQAALSGSPGIAVGNVVGSNIANILLILGVAALVRPIIVSPGAFRRDGTVLFLATMLCLGVVLMGTIGRPTGFVFVAALLAFLAATLIMERRGASPAADVYEAEAESLHPVGGSTLAAGGLFLAGLVLTILGARFLVDGAIVLAADLGVSEAVVGLTIVAVGTSLPELVTSVIAARKGQSDVAFGNIVGSNIFNILGILGVTALVRPLEAPPEIAHLDIWVMTGATLLMMAVAVTSWRISRGEGAAMLAGYAGYLGWLGMAAGKT